MFLFYGLSFLAFFVWLLFLFLYSYLSDFDWIRSLMGCSITLTGLAFLCGSVVVGLNEASAGAVLYLVLSLGAGGLFLFELRRVY